MRGPARDQVRLVRAVDADHPASGPVAEDSSRRWCRTPTGRRSRSGPAPGAARGSRSGPPASGCPARRPRSASARSAGRIGRGWRAGGRDPRPGGCGRACRRSERGGPDPSRLPVRAHRDANVRARCARTGSRQRRRTRYTSGNPSSVSVRTRATVRAVGDREPPDRRPALRVRPAGRRQLVGQALARRRRAARPGVRRRRQHERRQEEAPTGPAPTRCSVRQPVKRGAAGGRSG